MAPKSRAAASWLLGLGILACSSLPPLGGNDLLRPEVALDFERPVDLIPPEHSRITSTEGREIWLAWDPVLVGDVAGYAITRADDAGGPYELAGQTASRFHSMYRDRGSPLEKLADGRSYHYRIHPYDAQGQVSRSHAYLVATTDPAPTAPRGLRAYSNLPRRVVLEWEPSDDRSVVGYIVHRSPTVAGPWERVADVEGRLQTFHQDPVPGDLRVMYYRLRAQNAFAGESDMTAPIRAVTKAEPLPPIGLELFSRALGSVHLRWQRNVENDVGRYQVWRSESGDPKRAKERLIAEVAAPAIDLIDRAVGCEQKLRYRLRAIDRDDLVSGFSRALEVQGAGIGLAAKPVGGGLELRWKLPAGNGWTPLEVIERRTFLPDRSLGEPQRERALLLFENAGRSRQLRVVLARDRETQNDTAQVTSEQLTRLRCELDFEVSGH